MYQNLQVLSRLKFKKTEFVFQRSTSGKKIALKRK